MMMMEIVCLFLLMGCFALANRGCDDVGISGGAVLHVQLSIGCNVNTNTCWGTAARMRGGGRRRRERGGGELGMLHTCIPANRRSSQTRTSTES